MPRSNAAYRSRHCRDKTIIPNLRLRLALSCFAFAAYPMNILRSRSVFLPDNRLRQFLRKLKDGPPEHSSTFVLHDWKIDQPVDRVPVGYKFRLNHDMCQRAGMAS